MIRFLEQYNGEDLRESHYSRLLRAHLAAYGTDYDFCRFYEMTYRRRAGIICVFNGAMTADFCDGVKPTSSMRRELAEFVDFQQPYSVELPHEIALRQGFSGCISVERRFFEIPPKECSDGLIDPNPETVFSALGLPADSYPAWLTDTLRRVNRGCSELIGYGSSVLTVRFKSDGLAYITDLATPEDDRGKGYARELLGRASKSLWDRGFTAYLSAKPELFGFYRELGYPEIGEDKVYIQKERQ